MFNSPKLIYAVGAVLIIALVGGYLLVTQKLSPAEESASVREAIEQAVVETPTVAPSTNPLKQVTPTENPVEKTNPFKETYANPFQ